MKGERRHGYSLKLVIATSAGSSLAALFIALLIVYLVTDFAFLPEDACFISSVGAPTFCVFSDDLGSETYLSIISSFYETLINLLLVVIAAVAGTAFWTIRAQVLRQSEEDIEREVTRYFETDAGHTSTRKEIDAVFDLKAQNLRRRLEEIEAALEEAEIEIPGEPLGQRNEEAPR